MTEFIDSLPIEATVLCLLLICGFACATDLWRRKIPNALIAVGLILVLILQYHAWGNSGLQSAILGILAAFAATLPLLAMRAIAAGDSKLMLVVGAALGTTDMLLVLLLSLVIAGLIALLMTILTRRFSLFTANLSIAYMAASAGDLNGVREVSKKTAYKVPFACAVLTADIAWLLWVY